MRSLDVGMLRAIVDAETNHQVVFEGSCPEKKLFETTVQIKSSEGKDSDEIFRDRIRKKIFGTKIYRYIICLNLRRFGVGWRVWVINVYLGSLTNETTNFMKWVLKLRVEENCNWKKSPPINDIMVWKRMDKYSKIWTI